MSIDKFRFVSPGVYVNEIDNSQLPRLPEQMGPVIIGTSQRGPMMRPVKVQSFSDFIEVFGEPHPGNAGGDVWREGNKSAPTYGAYAAQAYLKNSGPVTFVRLGGYEAQEEGADEAGWASEKAYALYVMPLSQSSTDVYTTPVGAAASIAAIVYTTGSTPLVVGSELSGAMLETSASNKWLRYTGKSTPEFKLNIDSYTYDVNLEESSKKYIRSALNTNPVLYKDKKYFLGESFKSNVSSLGSNYAAAFVELKNYNNHKGQAKEAVSSWVVSQHKFSTSSFSAGADGQYLSLQKLFAVHGLTEGSWVSKNLKVSIEDIKEPVSEFIKYGTFTLSLRRMDDNDLTPQYVERFVGLSLDPTSDNYIAKKIGDKYTTWDSEKKEFVEYGNYDNKSKFIRIQMDAAVDAAKTDTDLLPFGFYSPQFYADQQLSGTSVTTTYLNTNLTANSVFTASFGVPVPNLLTSSLDSVAGSSFQSTYFGFKSTVDKTKKFEKDTTDLVGDLYHYENGGTYKLFSLDDISGSVSGSTLLRTKAVEWKPNNRYSNKSLTAQGSSSLLLQNFNRFTMPLIGGSDGFDITVANPFSQGKLKDKDETSSYAYNSVKVAIESVADPEVVECNAMAVPGICEKGLTGLLIDKCEVRGDALAVIDLEGDLDPEDLKAKPSVSTVITNLKNRAINSSYGCAYFPWVLVKDTINNNTVWMPPSVAALGTFSSSQKKTDLWFAPAGFNRGGLTDGAAGLPVVQTSLRLSSKDRDDLYLANINPIATFPSEGIVILGQKTLQVTPSALDRINVRRLMIYLKKEISRMARTVLFDPNIQVTWKRFTNQAVPFLDSVKSRFGLSDFKVVLDETTTTPELVDRNIVYAKILLKPTRAIEFIALDFVILPTGAAFTD